MKNARDATGRAGPDSRLLHVEQRTTATGASPEGLNAPAGEAMRKVWERRARQLAQVPVQEDEGERVELVVVRLGRELYGFDVEHVLEIRPVERIARVPLVPDWVVGVFNLRGRILPALSLRRLLGLGEVGERGGYLVVVETVDAEIALLVEDVLAVETLPSHRIRDTDDVKRGLSAECVLGAIERRGAPGDCPVLALLDLQALLADERLTVREEMV
jgi:purine-binding chemotaxis protein CheW